MAPFVLYVAVGLVLIGVGIPLLLRAVPPNRLYGFRTRGTLSTPAVWYPVNQVAGLWLILTGIATAVVAVWTHRMGYAFDVQLWINLAPVLLGSVLVTIHGMVMIQDLK